MQKRTRLLTKISLATLALSFALTGMTASKAEATKKPARVKEVRTTESDMSTYSKVAQVMRERTAGKSSATFYAEPHLLDQNAVALVTIRSIGDTGEIERFRCIATHDIAECLGAPVKIMYLPADTHVALDIELLPRGQAQPETAIATLH